MFWMCGASGGAKWVRYAGGVGRGTIITGEVNGVGAEGRMQVVLVRRSLYGGWKMLAADVFVVRGGRGCYELVVGCCEVADGGTIVTNY